MTMTEKCDALLNWLGRNAEYDRFTVWLADGRVRCPDGRVMTWGELAAPAEAYRAVATVVERLLAERRPEVSGRVG